MKVKTNLTAIELDTVAKGLAELSKRQLKAYPTENDAEVEILKEVDSLFNTMLTSLQDEIANTFK